MPQHTDTLGLLSALAPRNETLQRATSVGGPNVFESLFGGPDDPRMTPDQIQQARQASVLRAGFAGLLAAGQGANVLETVGQAGVAGLDARLAINANFEPPAATELSTQVVEVVGADGLKHRLLIDKNTGVTIADLGVSEIDKPDEFGNVPIKVQTPKGDVIFAFARDGDLIEASTGRLLVNAVPVDTPVGGQQMSIQTEDGNKYIIMVDSQTNEQIGPARFAGKVKSEDDEADDVITIKTMRRRFDEVRDLYASRGFKAFGPVDVYSEKVDLLRGVLTSEEFKQAKPAQDFIVSAVLKAIQGSRPSDFDMKMYLNFLVPRIGDTAVNVQQKLLRIEQMILDYEANPGRAVHKTWARVREANGLPIPEDEIGSGVYGEFDFEEEGDVDR